MSKSKNLRRAAAGQAAKAADRVARAAFEARTDRIKADIVAGRIRFWNGPPEWTEKLLNATALNCALLAIAEEVKWN